jgi:hypothetical protein
MHLRLPNPGARLAVVVLAFALAATLTFFSVRNARAANQAELGTRAGYEAAVSLEPSNPENWYLLGRYWQYTLDDPDPTLAMSNFRRALSLNPRYADAWLDLGTVYESEGDLSAARDAYLEARNAYPISATVAWRFGNFLLRQGEVPQAFAEIQRAVFADPKRSAEAFSRCWRIDPNVESVLDNVIPPDRAAYLDVIRELAAADQLAATLTVWQRLVSFHPRMSPADVISFVDFLMQKGHFDDAHRVWMPSSYPTLSLAILRVPYSGMAASNPTFAAAASPGLFPLLRQACKLSSTPGRSTLANNPCASSSTANATPLTRVSARTPRCSQRPRTDSPRGCAHKR